MLTLVLGLVVVGIVLYCINAFIPMDPKIKTILNIVVVVVVIIWLLSVFGIIGGLSTVRVPTLK